MGADQRLKDLKIKLPAPPTPFGAYVEAVQTGRLLFLSGMLPVVGREPRFLGRLGGEMTIDQGRLAAATACMNVLATAKKHIGSLDKIQRVVRLGVSLATTAEFRDHPKVADGASELLKQIFGREKAATRVVLGVHTLPMGMPVELDVIFELAD